MSPCATQVSGAENRSVLVRIAASGAVSGTEGLVGTLVRRAASVALEPEVKALHVEHAR